jgi:hypothetical protein
MASHPVLQLRDVLRARFTTRLPPNVFPVDDWVADPQFFPGAAGLLTESTWEEVSPGHAGHFEELPPPPNRGVIVVGNYFASLHTYKRVRSGEVGGLKRTWGTLRRLLRATSPREVFLTNAYIGLVDAEKDTARFPTTPEFDRRCAGLLCAEIELLRPRAVVCLGVPAARMLGRVVPGRLHAWQRSSLTALRDGGGALVNGCRVGDVTFDAAVVSHPSAVQPNAVRDQDAERVAMVSGAAGRH